MRYLYDWLYQHHLVPATFHPGRVNFVEILKNSWIMVLLFVMGVLAIISAVLISWPALAYLASKLFV